MHRFSLLGSARRRLLGGRAGRQPISVSLWTIGALLGALILAACGVPPTPAAPAAAPTSTPEPPAAAASAPATSATEPATTAAADAPSGEQIRVGVLHSLSGTM